MTLPKRLEEKFGQFKKILVRRSLMEWALLGAVILLVFFLLFFLWDRLVPVTSGARLLMLLLGLSGLLLIGPARSYFQAWKYRNRRDLTTLIKAREPIFGDRLQGILELRRQDSEKANFSPALRQAALEKISEEAETVDFRHSVPRDFRRGLLLTLVTLIFLLMGLCIFLPKQASNAAARYFLPLQEIPRYAVIRFDNLPKELPVARGESKQLKVLLKDPQYLSEVPELEVKVSGESSETLSYRNSGYEVSLPPLEKRTKLLLQAGDAVARVILVPRDRPTVSKLEVMQTFPSYLQRPPVSQRMESSYLEAVEGSSLDFSLETDSELKDVNTQPTLMAKISGNSAQLEQMTVTERVKLSISLKDEDGLESSRPKDVTIQSRKDAPPKAFLSGKEKEIILLPHETLDLFLSAKDDFGLQDLSLFWHPISSELEVQSTLCKKGSPSSEQMKSSFAFNPEILKVYPNSYHLYASAGDYYPEREPTRSTPLTLHLLSLEGHAEYLRIMFTDFIDRLEETYEEERTLYFENQRLAESSAETLRSPEMTSRLKSSIQGESGQIKALSRDQLSAVELLNESLRNPQLHRATVKSFARLSEKLRALHKNSLPEVRNTLEGAFDNRFSNEHARDQLALVVTLQETALKDFKKAIEEARVANQSFESSTFVHRLSELARAQGQYSTSIWQSIPETIGLTPADLDPLLRGNNEAFAERQSTHRQSLRWIEEDLRNYASRSEQDAFIDLAEKIVNSHVYGDMVNVETSLGENHASLASGRARKCALTISTWVEGLSEDLGKGAGAGAGGGGGGNSQQEQDTEFMLRMMEIIRTQQDLRGKTRAIEQSKRLESNEEESEQ